jgi:hypothetical protein
VIVRDVPSAGTYGQDARVSRCSAKTSRETMPEIVFTTRLTADDWDEAMHGWRCQVLNVPGAIVEAVYVEGARIDTARYEVLSQNTFIRWMAPDQPQRAAASIKLTEALSLGKDTERWKRLAIILPVIATVAAAAITAAATYLSRPHEVHAQVEPAPHPDNHQQMTLAMPAKSDGSTTWVRGLWAHERGAAPTTH